MRKILISFLMLFLTATCAAAAEPMPEAGIDRIKWSAVCCGSAPDRIYISAAVLLAVIVVSIIYYKNISGGDGNAK